MSERSKRQPRKVSRLREGGLKSPLGKKVCGRNFKVKKSSSSSGVPALREGTEAPGADLASAPLPSSAMLSNETFVSLAGESRNQGAVWPCPRGEQE